MTWQKNGTVKTARVGNTELSGRVYFSDADANPPNELRVEITITIDEADGTVRTEAHDESLATLMADSVKRTTFKQLWGELRDAALPLMGYTDNP